MSSEEITFPPVVVFKGDNGSYLRRWTYDHNNWYRTNFLQFSGEKYEEEATFEVINQDDGYVAIRSLQTGKYWNGNPGAWIRCNGDEIDQYALFRPVVFEDNKVCFIYKETNCYVKRYSHDGWTSLLNAARKVIDQWSYLTVEEPVTRRTITNVIYDLDDKDIISIEPMVLEEQVIRNPSSLNTDFAVNYTHTTQKSFSFERSIAFSSEVKTSIEAGIPGVVGGAVEVSMSVTSSLQWNTTKTETSSVSGTITVKDVPPGKTVKVTISGEKAVINVPFTYQQIDYMSDGTTKTTDLFDGVFKGMDQYFARYTTEEL